MVNGYTKKWRKKLLKSGFAKRFTKKYLYKMGAGAIRIKSWEYDEQMPLFQEYQSSPEYNRVYIRVVGEDAYCMLNFSFADFQEELFAYMDSIGAAKGDPDRNLLYVLDNRRFCVVENFLEAVRTLLTNSLAPAS
ncbi:hypothetical protein [Succiniclasticum ruminis]|uniref:Uncharacterized protein n=1 Tax=Succiniclasticum ruminis DSM 9236 TaxID=1123323 RepID=A0A1I2D4U0_9FIRM|nr:hypothetical protein [Succiniclasticum ruminis]SFE75512.1 hypothetical protein SAMN05216245_1174 [Succiniclasticum ruminis DSM 9236]